MSNTLMTTPKVRVCISRQSNQSAPSPSRNHLMTTISTLDLAVLELLQTTMTTGTTSYSPCNKINNSLNLTISQSNGPLKRGKARAIQISGKMKLNHIRLAPKIPITLQTHSGQLQERILARESHPIRLGTNMHGLEPLALGEVVAVLDPS